MMYLKLCKNSFYTYFSDSILFNEKLRYFYSKYYIYDLLYKTILYRIHFYTLFGLRDRFEEVNLSV